MKSGKGAAWEVLEADLTYVFMNQSFLCYSGLLSTCDETHKEHARQETRHPYDLIQRHGVLDRNKGGS